MRSIIRFWWLRRRKRTWVGMLILKSSNFEVICWKDSLHVEVTQFMMVDFTVGVKVTESYVSKSTVN